MSISIRKDKETAKINTHRTHLAYTGVTNSELNFLTFIVRDTLQDVRAWLIAVLAAERITRCDSRRTPRKPAMDGRRE
ncbi:MAG: hypothetical protein U9P37_05925 [Pseudomonadota bacterium]|nr:hypothetical protein [Pseudomonadota bacterium]